MFLLIMSGFWTSFDQTFYTMPEHIRDFVETRPMVTAFERVFGESSSEDPDRGVAASLATINELEREEIASRLRALVERHGEDLEAPTFQVIIRARQVNPEFIVNIDAGAIVLLQVLVSFLMARFHRFTTMIVGMLIAAAGIGLSAFAGTEGMVGAGGSVWLVALGLLTFAIGEMMASPTSQDYVGRIAPSDKKALCMGYCFVAIALGNLFGGILSGELYGHFARDMQRPDLMWLAFGGIMLPTAVTFLLYNRLALPRGRADRLTDEA